MDTSIINLVIDSAAKEMAAYVYFFISLLAGVFLTIMLAAASFFYPPLMPWVWLPAALGLVVGILLARFK